MKYGLILLPFFLALSAKSQESTVLIHIKLINGRTGNPMKNEAIGLEDRNGYREISARTNEVGIASIYIDRNAVILTHNTHGYVDCADERGGVIRNDFKVSQILSTGILQQIAQPNQCGKTSGGAKPGELVLFVRPWNPGEDI